MLSASLTWTWPAGTVWWHTLVQRGKRPLLPVWPAMLPALGEKLALLPGASAWAVPHLCSYHHRETAPEHKEQWESLWVQGMDWPAAGGDS